MRMLLCRTWNMLPLIPKPSRVAEGSTGSLWVPVLFCIRKPPLFFGADLSISPSFRSARRSVDLLAVNNFPGLC